MVMVKDEKSPKYLNSPETEIYQKSKLVYGIYQARNAIRQHDECFLTEGYTDVISMHQAGIENVVASSGTSLTEDQIKLIKRFTDNITILYDGDEAGIKAALRGLELMASQDVNIRVVLLPDGDDPDSFLHKKGSAALREFIHDNKKHFLQFKTEVLMKDAGNDPLKRADVIKEVVSTLALVPDVVRRSILLKEVSRMLDVKEQVLITEVNKLRRTKFRKESGAEKFEADALQQSATESPDHSEQLYLERTDELQERDIIRLLLEFGKNKMEEKQTVAEFILEEVREVSFNHMHYQLMLHEIQSQVEAGSIPDHHHFLEHDDAELKRLAMEIVSSPYVLSENWNKMHDIYVKVPSENFINDVKNSLNRFKIRKVMTMMTENLKELKTVQGNPEEESHFLRLHQQLTEWKQQLGKRMGTVVVG
ncbi:MAG: DNA primase, partial [Chitinophagales bacterium]